MKYVLILLASIVIMTACARNDDAYWAGVAKETGERTKR